MKSVLQLLMEISATQRISLFLIGGYALQAYGVVRQTLDVDALVCDVHAMTLDAAMSQAGYKAVARSEIFTRYRHPSMLLPDVDILYVSSDTASTIADQARECTLGEVICLVPSLPHLLSMKLHAITSNPEREARDVADIIELLRANPESIGKAELHRLCTRYASESVWERVRSSCGRHPEVSNRQDS